MTKTSTVREHTTIAHQRGARLSKAHRTLGTLRRKWHAGRKQACRTVPNREKKRAYIVVERWFHYLSSGALIHLFSQSVIVNKLQSFISISTEQIEIKFLPWPGPGRGGSLISGRDGLLASIRKLLKNTTSFFTSSILSPCLLRMCFRTNSGPYDLIWHAWNLDVQWQGLGNKTVWLCTYECR